MNLTLTRPDGHPLPSDGRGLGVRAFFNVKFPISSGEHEGGA